MSQTTPPRELHAGWRLRAGCSDRTAGRARTGRRSRRARAASHGHNVVAADDACSRPTTCARWRRAGTYPSDRLSCISCHDPHGRYRLDASGAVRTRRGSPIRLLRLLRRRAARAPGAGQRGRRLPAPRRRRATRRSRRARSCPSRRNPPVALAPQTLQPERAHGGGPRRVRRGDVRVVPELPRPHPLAVGPEHHEHVHRTRRETTRASNAGNELAIYNAYVRSGALTGLQTAVVHVDGAVRGGHDGPPDARPARGERRDASALARSPARRP